MREFYEETGLQITADQVDTSKQHTEQYISWSKRHGHDVAKTVIYYTALLPYTDVTQLSGYSESDGEILGKKILPLTEAIALTTYEGNKDILRKTLQQVNTMSQ
jgi:8-oxo-dGTP pyrophosphatase MutT (NUDIX family)